MQIIILYVIDSDVQIIIKHVCNRLCETTLSVSTILNLYHALGSAAAFGPSSSTKLTPTGHSLYFRSKSTDSAVHDTLYHFVITAHFLISAISYPPRVVVLTNVYQYSLFHLKTQQDVSLPEKKKPCKNYI